MSALTALIAEVEQHASEIHSVAADALQVRRRTVALLSACREWREAEQAAHVEARRLFQSAERTGRLQ